MIGNKFKGLGRGLSALIGDIPQDNAQTKSSSEKVPIHFVYANPSQPRKNFNQDLLNELSESIKEQGIIQPILVRKNQKTNMRSLLEKEDGEQLSLQKFTKSQLLF